MSTDDLADGTIEEHELLSTIVMKLMLQYAGGSTRETICLTGDPYEPCRVTFERPDGKGWVSIEADESGGLDIDGQWFDTPFHMEFPHQPYSDEPEPEGTEPC